MYVCVCNAVTERDIGGAVAKGRCTLRELRTELGVGAGCGRCARCARDVLNDTLQTARPHGGLVSQRPSL